MPVKRTPISEDVNDAPDVVEVNTNGVAGIGAEAQPEQTKRRGAPRGPRTGPTLVWTDDMRKALKVTALKIEKGILPGTLTLPALADQLRSHPAFSHVPPELIEPGRINSQITLLEGKGVTFPKVGRASSARVSQEDVAALNDISLEDE